MLNVVRLLIILIVALVIGAVVAIVAAAGSKKETSQASGKESYFDGNTWQLIGYRILSALLCGITLGIAYPWTLCMVQKWEVKHTVINGRRLKFTGEGHQLIGKYILWVFLTIITFGIYSIWLGLGMKKWVVKHTVYADEKKKADSYFSGGAGGYLGIHILSFLLILFTFGIGTAWATKMILKWEAKHTHIGGSPLEFNGTGGQLFGKYLLLAILTPLTLGIYALFFTVSYKKWETKHTDAVYQTPQIQAKARAHEATAVQDFAKYRIAANDQEIAAMKSGYTGKEDAQALEQMAEDGNPYAAYHLARLLKGENTVYEGSALTLLVKAAEAKHHEALLDLARQQPSGQSISVLTQAAQCGSGEASWLLAQAYQKANDLPHAAYWFKVALEWGIAEAKSSEKAYEDLIQNIALQLSENRYGPKQNKALAVVLGIVGGLLVLVIAFGIMAIFGIRVAKQDEAPMRQQTVYLETVDVEDIQGETCYGEDQFGNEVVYILDDSAFFDNENRILYLHFGLLEYEENVYLRCDNGWRTQAITPGNGITEVSYPFFVKPSYIEVWAKYDETSGCLIQHHSLNVEEGTEVEAEQWLEDKYPSIDPTDPPVLEIEDPTEPPAITESSIVGQWERTDVVTSIYTGEDILYIWRKTFHADGSYVSIFYECTTSVNGNEYYYGRCWARTGGDRGEGTYSVNGSTVTITSHEVNGGEYYSNEYSFTVTEDTLLLDEDVFPKEYQKVTEQKTAEQNTAELNILGQWYYCIGTSDTSMELKKWVFREDGTCDIILEYCFPSDNPNDIYYGGTYWSVGSGNAYPGTYTLNGTELTVTTDVSEPGDPPQMSASTYTVQITGDYLSAYSHRTGNSEEFVKLY